MVHEGLTMPRARFERMEPARKQELLEAAANDLAKHGYEGASVNRILDEAGFSKSSFYYYFDDKADLVGTVLLEAYSKPIALLREIRLPSTAAAFWKELDRVQRQLLDEIEGDPRTFALITGLAGALLKHPQLLQRLTPFVVEAKKRMGALWARGQALGAVRDDLSVDALMTMIEAVKRAAWQSAFAPSHRATHAEVEAFAEHLLDLIKRLTAPQFNHAVSR